MTTIAFKDGIMASDSCISAGGIKVASMAKVLRTSAGAIIGWSGETDNRAVLALLDNVRTPAELPSKQELTACETDFALLIAFAPRQVYRISCGSENGRYDASVHPASLGIIAAVGSGYEIALGAMAAGKNACEAVEIACQIDCRSQLPVHSIGFEPARSKKPKSRPK